MLGGLRGQPALGLDSIIGVFAQVVVAEAPLVEGDRGDQGGGGVDGVQGRFQRHGLLGRRQKFHLHHQFHNRTH
ncbi:hypothetical protein ACGFJC_29625 [Nonomuraea fuscirosea]|uniref:hypothetical protein n=1 Tax=Nonomuraea fuscirosea TaxID=1291556 RepID=UPI0034333C99